MNAAQIYFSALGIVIIVSLAMACYHAWQAGRAVSD